MIALAQPSDKALRAQIAESVSIVAQVDFPEQWSTLFTVSDIHYHLLILIDSIGTS